MTLSARAFVFPVVLGLGHLLHLQHPHVHFPGSRKKCRLVQGGHWLWGRWQGGVISNVNGSAHVLWTRSNAGFRGAFSATFPLFPSQVEEPPPRVLGSAETPCSIRDPPPFHCLSLFLPTHCLSLCLPHSVSLLSSLSLPPSLCLFLTLYRLFSSISVSVSPPFSFSLCLSLCLSLCVFLFFGLPASLFLSPSLLALYLCLPLSLSVFLCLHLSLSLCLFCLSLSVSVSLSLSLFILSVSLSLFSVPPSLSPSSSVSVSFSVSASLCLCIAVSVSLSPSLSVCLPMTLSVSTCHSPTYLKSP